MVSEKLMEKMIMEGQRRGSEECHRGEMTDDVREREIAVMKVQLHVLEEWLQEQEIQKRRMDISTEGKESDLETIADEVEANSDCLIEKGT